MTHFRKLENRWLADDPQTLSLQNVNYLVKRFRRQEGERKELNVQFQP